MTHNHQFAADLHRSAPTEVRFLRAMRGDGSGRSFHITEAPPESTSHGMDLYGRIVGAARPVIRRSPGPRARLTREQPAA